MIYCDGFLVARWSDARITHLADSFGPDGRRQGRGLGSRGYRYGPETERNSYTLWHLLR